MDAILNYKRSEDDDYYHILGCDVTSNMEQILAGYKALSLQYHPDKNPDDEEAVLRFQKIVKAKEILMDPEKKAVYDKWYRSGFSVPFEQFLNMNKSAHTSVHWATKKKDLMLDDGGSAQCTQPPTETARGEDRSRSKSVCWNTTWERDPPSDLLKKFRNYEI